LEEEIMGRPKFTFIIANNLFNVGW
jgi:hypothetical protein